LRDYVPDDSYRQINWKATARLERPITSVLQTERSQEIVVCVDHGRTMGNPAGRGTLLDAAVEAAMLVARAAVGEGDRVGLAIWADTINRWRPPGAGGLSCRALLDDLAACDVSESSSSPMDLAGHLGRCQRKRSLVFVWTDLGDPRQAGDLAKALRPLSRRHVAVVLCLRGSGLEQLASGGPGNRREVCQTLAARKLCQERETRVAEIRRLGVDVVEVPDSGRLALESLNLYLAVKARQRL